MEHSLALVTFWLIFTHFFLYIVYGINSYVCVHVHIHVDTYAFMCVQDHAEVRDWLNHAILCEPTFVRQNISVDKESTKLATLIRQLSLGIPNLWLLWTELRLQMRLSIPLSFHMGSGYLNYSNSGTPSTFYPFSCSLIDAFPLHGLQTWLAGLVNFELLLVCVFLQPIEFSQILWPWIWHSPLKPNWRQ